MNENGHLEEVAQYLGVRKILYEIDKSLVFQPGSWTAMEV